MTEIVAVDEQAVHATDLQRASLVDLLDRLIGNGVVLSGDIVISLAGVDLVLLRLRALLTTVREAEGIRS
ncbi:MAG TPA: gas vesicle protein GvpJ [Jatrophihabitans sp.]